MQTWKVISLKSDLGQIHLTRPGWQTGQGTTLLGHTPGRREKPFRLMNTALNAR